MIKLIIFDLGGLLVENYDIPMFEALAKACNKPREVIENECAELMQQSERGEITEYKFLKHFLEEQGCKKDHREIIKIRRKATKEQPRIRAFIKSLRKNYKVAYATNNSEEEFASINFSSKRALV